MKNDINAMKLNIVASGQAGPGFSTEQGVHLASEVAKLTTRFDSLATEHQ